MSLIPTHRAPWGAALLIMIAAALVTTPFAGAQSAHGEPRDLAFRIVNGSTGEPGTVERLVVSYLQVMAEVVLDTRPEGSSFEIEDVPVSDDGRYVVTAWAGGVPYYFGIKGRELVAGEQTLQVFDTTRDLAAAGVAGLNLVVRREGELVDLEFMLQVRNETRPAVTIHGGDATFWLALPGDAKEVAAEYHRGPTPTAVPVRHAGGDRWTVGAPLTPGVNRLRVIATVPWREDLELNVGSELSVAAWSLLATPEWLEVDSRQLEPDPGGAGVKRMVGPELEAGETLAVRLRSGTGQTTTAQDVFSTDAPATAEAEAEAAEAEGGGGLPGAVQIGLVLLVIVIGVLMARRRS